MLTSRFHWKVHCYLSKQLTVFTASNSETLPHPTSANAYMPTNTPVWAIKIAVVVTGKGNNRDLKSIDFMQKKLLTNWWCWATRWTVFNVTSSPPSITKWVWIALSTNNLCGALAAADNSQFFRILLPSHITGTWAYTKGSVTISDKLSSKLQKWWQAQKIDFTRSKRRTISER